MPFDRQHASTPTGKHDWLHAGLHPREPPLLPDPLAPPELPLAPLPLAPLPARPLLPPPVPPLPALPVTSPGSGSGSAFGSVQLPHSEKVPIVGDLASYWQVFDPSVPVASQVHGADSPMLQASPVYGALALSPLRPPEPAPGVLVALPP